MKKYDGNDIRDLVLYSIEHDDTIYGMVEKLNHNFDQILRHERTDFMDVLIRSVLQSIANGDYADILGSNGQKVVMIGKPGRDGRDGSDGSTVIQASQSTKFLSKRTSDLREIQQNSYSVNIPQDPSLESERIALMKYRPGDVVFTKDGDLLVVENITDTEIFFTRKINYKSLVGASSGTGSSSGSPGGTSLPSSSAFFTNTDIEGSRVKEHILQSPERILLGTHNQSHGESNSNTRYLNLGIGIGRHAYGDPSLALANIPQMLSSDANVVDSGIKDQLRFYFRKNSQQSFDEATQRYWAFVRYIDLYEDSRNRSAVTGQRLRFGLENSDGEDSNQPFWELHTDKRSRNSSFTSHTNTLSVYDPNTKRSIVLDNRSSFSIKSAINGLEKSILSTDIADSVLSTSYPTFSVQSVQTDMISPKSGEVVSISPDKGFYADYINTKKISGVDKSLVLAGDTILTLEGKSNIRIGDKLLTEWIADSDKKIKDFDKKKLKVNTLFTDVKAEPAGSAGFEIDLRTLGFPLFNPVDKNNMSILAGERGLSPENLSTSRSNIYLPILYKSSTESGLRYSPLHRMFGIFQHNEVDALLGTPQALSINQDKFVWKHIQNAKDTKKTLTEANGGQILDFENYLRIPSFSLKSGNIQYSHILFPDLGMDDGMKKTGHVLTIKPAFNFSGDSVYSVETERKNKTYYLKLHPEIYNDPSEKNPQNGFKLQDGWYIYEYDPSDVNSYQRTKFSHMRVNTIHKLRYGDESTYDNRGGFDNEENRTIIENYRLDGSLIKENGVRDHYGMQMWNSFASFDNEYNPSIQEHFVQMIQHNMNYVYMNTITVIYGSNPSAFNKSSLSGLYDHANRHWYPNYYKANYKIPGQLGYLFMPVKFRGSLQYLPYSDRSLNQVPCNTKNFFDVYNSADKSDKLAYSNDMFSIKVSGDVVNMDIYVECSILESIQPVGQTIDVRNYAYQRYSHYLPTYGMHIDDNNAVAIRNLSMVDCGSNSTAHDSWLEWRTGSDFFPTKKYRTYDNHDIVTKQHSIQGRQYNLYSSSGFTMRLLIPSLLAPVTDIMFSDNTTLYNDDLCSVSISPYSLTSGQRSENVQSPNLTSINKRTIVNRKTTIGDGSDNVDFTRTSLTSGGVSSGTSLTGAQMYDGHGVEFSGFTSLYKEGVGFAPNHAIHRGFAPNVESYTPLVVSFRNPNDIQQINHTVGDYRTLMKERHHDGAIREYVVHRDSGVKYKRISLTWIKPGVSEIIEKIGLSRAGAMSYELDNKMNVQSYPLYSSLLHESLEKYHELSPNNRLDVDVVPPSGSSGTGAVTPPPTNNGNSLTPQPSPSDPSRGGVLPPDDPQNGGYTGGGGGGSYSGIGSGSGGRGSGGSRGDNTNLESDMVGGIY